MSTILYFSLREPEEGMNVAQITHGSLRKRLRDVFYADHTLSTSEVESRSEAIVDVFRKHVNFTGEKLAGIAFDDDVPVWAVVAVTTKLRKEIPHWVLLFPIRETRIVSEQLSHDGMVLETDTVFIGWVEL